MTSSIDFKNSVDTRASWTISAYGEHGKTANKVGTIPQTLKKLDSKNIVDYLKVFTTTLDVNLGALLCLTYPFPSDDDPALLTRVENSMRDGEMTAQTRKIWKKLQMSQRNWKLSEKSMKSALLQVSSEEPLILKKILDHQGDVYSLIKSLVKDYGTENSFNAMKIKEQLYQTKMDSTKTAKEFVESLELVFKNLVTAGASIPDEDLAMLAINALKTDPRYSGSTKAYEAVLVTSHLKASWEDVKTHAINLGEGDTDTASAPKIKNPVAMFARGKEKVSYCHQCKVKHPHGKHLTDKKIGSIAAMADAVVQRVQNSFSNNGGGRGRGRGGRYNRGGGRFGARSFGRFSGRFGGRGGGAYQSSDSTSTLHQSADYGNSSITCYNCGEKGHIARDCTKNSNPGDKRQRETAFSTIQNGESEYLTELRRAVRQQLSGSGAFPTLNPDRLQVILSTYSEDVRKFIFLVDSGASCTLVYAHLHQLRNTIPSRFTREIRTADRGVLTVINEGILWQVPVTGMGPELLIQLCAVNTLIELDYRVLFERNGLRIWKPTADPAWKVHYDIPIIDGMYILDIREAVHEFGKCEVRLVSTADVLPTVATAAFDDSDTELIPTLENDEDDDVEIVDIQSLLNQSAPSIEYLDEVGPFSLVSTDISARIHQIPTSISISSFEESGPFDLVSIRSATRAPSSAAAGGAGPVAGGAATPRIKLPKRKEQPTAEAARSVENRSAEIESASNVARENAIAAEEFFLRSPDAKALFDETQ